VSGRVVAAVAVAAIALLVLVYVLPSYSAKLIAEILVFGIFAMSLDLLLGYGGLPSLGHAAYFGTSAYVAAAFSVRLGLPLWIAVPAGLTASVLAAAIFHLVALRTAKAYYLMISLAFSQVLWSIAVSWTAVTGGDNGLPIAPLLIFGSQRGYLGVLVVAFFLCLGAMWIVVSSPFGYALRGIRENERRMEALGYHVWAYKYVLTLVSALFAGIAGELFLYLENFVGPSTLSVTLSAQVLMMTVVGAAGTLFGSVIGAVIFVFLQHVLSTYTARWLSVMGLVYVIVALYTPGGLFSFFFRRRQPKPAALP
jgi:branched-chain amino acid transport system permease protein